MMRPSIFLTCGMQRFYPTTGHLEMEERENLESGMTLEEAHYAALRRFGNATLVRERSREMWGWNSVETLVQDVRYGVRQLRRNPGFTAVAVITLALGIGANTAIFSVVEGVLLAPLPYAEPDRLVAIWESHPNAPHVWISYPNFRDWQRNARSFQQMVAFTWVGSDLTSPGTPEHLEGKLVSAVSSALVRRFRAAALIRRRLGFLVL